MNINLHQKMSLVWTMWTNLGRGDQDHQRKPLSFEADEDFFTYSLFYVLIDHLILYSACHHCTFFNSPFLIQIIHIQVFAWD